MKEFIKKVQKYYKYTIYSGKAELKSETANSHLSWLWWILDPLLFMLVYSFIALIVFGKGEKFFPAFVFIGLTCWQFFERTVKQSVTLVTKNSQIVTKVYIPKYILIFVKMFSNGIKLSISFCLVFIMMFLLRVPIGLNILFFIPILLILGVVTFGISTILLHFGVFVEDLANVITVLLKLVFYLSGIFYSIVGRVDEPFASILQRLNPVALIISSMRDCMIYSKTPDIPWLLLWLLVGFILSYIGINVIHKYENSYVKVI